MRRALIAVSICAAVASAARAEDAWAAWQPLLGTFVSDGATLTLERALDGRVLVRRNRSGAHEDLMVIYAERGQTRADYYDNEGHVIRYEVTLAGSKVVFLAGARPDAPGFRLTCDFSEHDTLAMTFEVAPPGQASAFKTYLAGTMRRKR
jgi:hypothetical protein